jgi:hypothetical protein
VRNEPLDTALATSSSSPGSMIGLLPEEIMSSLLALMSTPHTSCPFDAKQAALTRPT